MRATTPSASSRRAPKFAGPWRAVAVMLLGLLASLPGPLPAHVTGTPFIRSYSYEEIGSVSRGARLGFDQWGHVAVARAGVCAILNETTWIDVADRSTDDGDMQRLVFAADGRAYFGSFGSWGVAEYVNGLLRPRPLVPATIPAWAAAANFEHIQPVPSGAWFEALEGLVYWNRAENRTEFFPLTARAHLFAIGETAYVSSRSEGLHVVDLPNRALVPLACPELRHTQVEHAVALDATRVLLATNEGNLFVFDGRRATPWPGPLGRRALGQVSALVALADGNVGIAVNGEGLFLANDRGEIFTALTTADHQRVLSLAAREAGVLWIAHENGVEKILYENPLTAIGQRQGLAVSWPQVVEAGGTLFVTSGGRLYESLPAASAAEPTRFQLTPGQPSSSAWWAIAASGSHLLVGSSEGAFVRSPDGRFEQVLAGLDVARLVMLNPDVCFAIGATEIATLQRRGPRWVETGARVAGVGYPRVVHANDHAAWVELGHNRAARLSLREGRIQVRLFESFPWTTRRWINLGLLGDLVILNGGREGRVYFDDVAEQFVESPELDGLFTQAPTLLNRVRASPSGAILATHDRGLYEIVPDTRAPGSHRFRVLAELDDHYPLMQPVSGDDVWLATSQSLYHLASHRQPPAAVFRPMLITASDARTNREIARSGDGTSLGRLPHAANSLTLRFFAGSYALRNPPRYEFRLRRDGASWPVLGNGSTLTLSDLHEGAYELEVTIRNTTESTPPAVRLRFEIAPPWFRSPTAYFFFAFAAAALVALVALWVSRGTRQRNAMLEKLVAERTSELRAAMDQLGEETRYAATLAERNRLAGELHDSVQQGLGGLLLHLDGTLKLPAVSHEIRDRLHLARNMVTFTREEVQHAVWDLESPLMENADLAVALRKITTILGPAGIHLVVHVSGKPVGLSSAQMHHLLRIAQEAITNAVRHAEAKEIALTLEYGFTEVRLAIVDDGRGFDPSTVLTGGIGSFGLRGMRARAAKIDAVVTVESAPGKGTRVTVVTPIPHPLPTDVPVPS